MHFIRIFPKYGGHYESAGWFEYGTLCAGFDAYDNSDRWSKLVFDLSEMPSDITIKRVKLMLYMFGHDGDYGAWEGTHKFRLSQCSDESFSSSTGTLKEISVIEKECKNQWFEFDVTDEVISEFSGDKTIAFVVDSPQKGIKGCAFFYSVNGSILFPHLYVEYEGTRIVRKTLLGYELTGWRGTPITWLKNGVTEYWMFNGVYGESYSTIYSIGCWKAGGGITAGGYSSGWKICYNMGETPSTMGIHSSKWNKYVNGYIKDSLVYHFHAEPEDGLIFEAYYILPMKEDLLQSLVIVVHIKNASGSTKTFNWGFYSGEYHADDRFPDGSTEEYESSDGSMKIKHPEGKTWIVKPSELPSSVYINGAWRTSDYSGPITGQFWYKYELTLNPSEERILMITNVFGSDETEASEILSKLLNYTPTSILDETINWWRDWLRDTFVVETDYPEIDELVNICRCYCKGHQVKDYYGFAAGSVYTDGSWPSDNATIIHMAIAYGHTDMSIPYLTVKIPKNIDYAKEHYGKFVWHELHRTALYGWSYTGIGYRNLEVPTYVNEVAEQLKRLRKEERSEFMKKVWSYIREIMDIIDGCLISEEDSEEMWGAFDWYNVIDEGLAEPEYDSLIPLTHNSGGMGKTQTNPGLCLYFAKLYRNASYLASYMGFDELAEDWWNKHLRMLELVPKFINEAGVYWGMWTKKYGFHEVREQGEPDYNPYRSKMSCYGLPHLRSEFALPEEVLEVNRFACEKYMENIVDMESKAWFPTDWQPSDINWIENKIYDLDGVSFYGNDNGYYIQLLRLIYAGLFEYVRYGLEVMLREQYGTRSLPFFEEGGCYYHGVCEFGCTNRDMIRGKGALAFIWAPYILEHENKYSLLFHPFWGRCKIVFGDGTEIVVTKKGNDSKFLQSVRVNGVEHYVFDYKWKRFWVTIDKCSLNNVEIQFGDEPPSKPSVIPDDFTIVLEDDWNDQLKILKIKLEVPHGVRQIIKFRLPHVNGEPYLTISGGEIISSSWNSEDKILEVAFKASSEVVMCVYPSYLLYYFYSGRMVTDFALIMSIMIIIALLREMVSFH